MQYRDTSGLGGVLAMVPLHPPQDSTGPLTLSQEYHSEQGIDESPANFLDTSDIWPKSKMAAMAIGSATNFFSIGSRMIIFFQDTIFEGGKSNESIAKTTLAVF